MNFGINYRSEMYDRIEEYYKEKVWTGEINPKKYVLDDYLGTLARLHNGGDEGKNFKIN